MRFVISSWGWKTQKVNSLGILQGFRQRNLRNYDRKNWKITEKMAGIFVKEVECSGIL